MLVTRGIGKKNNKSLMVSFGFGSSVIISVVTNINATIYIKGVTLPVISIKGSI